MYGNFRLSLNKIGATNETSVKHVSVHIRINNLKKCGYITKRSYVE